MRKEGKLTRNSRNPLFKSGEKVIGSTNHTFMLTFQTLICLYMVEIYV